MIIKEMDKHFIREGMITIVLEESKAKQMVQIDILIKINNNTSNNSISKIFTKINNNNHFQQKKVIILE